MVVRRCGNANVGYDMQCKRRNSMVKEVCECGHEVCEGCERGVWLGETAED